MFYFLHHIECCHRTIEKQRDREKISKHPSSHTDTTPLHWSDLVEEAEVWRRLIGEQLEGFLRLGLCIQLPVSRRRWSRPSCARKTCSVEICFALHRLADPLCLEEVRGDEMSMADSFKARTEHVVVTRCLVYCFKTGFVEGEDLVVSWMYCFMKYDNSVATLSYSKFLFLRYTQRLKDSYLYWFLYWSFLKTFTIICSSSPQNAQKVCLTLASWAMTL